MKLNLKRTKQSSNTRHILKSSIATASSKASYPLRKALLLTLERHNTPVKPRTISTLMHTAAAPRRRCARKDATATATPACQPSVATSSMSHDQAKHTNSAWRNFNQVSISGPILRLIKVEANRPTHKLNTLVCVQSQNILAIQGRQQQLLGSR